MKAKVWKLMAAVLDEPIVAAALCALFVVHAVNATTSASRWWALFIALLFLRTVARTERGQR